LGLAIVKHIVERHRGRLDITSALGKGTRAVVRIPLADSGGQVNPDTSTEDDGAAAGTGIAQLS
jgi:two-component system phosphate regulon sensor histidine kinase PhoR